MTPWTIEFTTKAEKDIDNIDHSQRIQVNKAILKVSKNPLPQNEGSYGEPLGNKMIACYKRTETVPPEYTVLRIPSQTWAVFATEWKTETDDEKLHDIWKRIYSEWFPTVNYEHADCDFDIEIYFGDEQSGYGAEIWIPVIKK